MSSSTLFPESGPRPGPALALAVVVALFASVAAGTGCADGDPRPASWAYISAAILEPNCATASCHGPGAAAAGLDFSTAENGYISLTGLWVWVVDDDAELSESCHDVDGVRLCLRPQRPIIQAYNPAQSRLVHVLRAQGAPRMPPDRPLPEADLQLIERWILEGAHEHADGDGAP